MKEVKGYVVIGYQSYEDGDIYPICLGLLHETKEEAQAAAENFLNFEYESMLDNYNSDNIELDLEDLYLGVCDSAEIYELVVKAVY